MAAAIQGFDQLETFDPPPQTSKDRVGNAVVAVVLSLLIFGLLFWMLSSFQIAAPTPLIVAAVVAVLVIVALFVQQHHAERTQPRASLRISPEGIFFANSKWEFDLPWEGLERAGQVSGMKPGDITAGTSGGGSLGPAKAAVKVIQALTGDALSGVSGRGTLRTTVFTDPGILVMIRQNHAEQNLPVGTSGFRTGIHLAMFESAMG